MREARTVEVEEARDARGGGGEGRGGAPVDGGGSNADQAAYAERVRSERAAGAAAEPTSTEEEELGDLQADRVGASVEEPDDVAPEVPARDLEGPKQEIAGVGPALTAQAAEPVGPVEAVPVSGGEGVASPELAGSIAAAQGDAQAAMAGAEAESAAYKAEVRAAGERHDAEQHACMLEQLRTMSPTDKRATLAEMGLDAKQLKKVKDGELDGLIEGNLVRQQRKTRILGMDEAELAGLSEDRKLDFLVDLGVDRDDLVKAGPARAARLFDDVMRVAHVPGTHKVKIKISGGLRGKSWEIGVRCDAEGNPEFDVKKQGGLLSRMFGWVKAALPIVLGVIAPITGGASLIALSVMQAVNAIRTGNWLGAAIGVAGALVGAAAFAKGMSGAASAFRKVGEIAGKAQKVAQAAQAAMAAAKAKNAGSLLGALASGAAAFAGAAATGAGKFAQTMKRWEERLTTWSGVVAGGQRVVAGIKAGDPVAAIGGALAAATAATGGQGKTGKQLARATSITRFVGAGQRALGDQPPDYGAVAEAALGIAGELRGGGRLEDAARIVGSANRVKAAWANRGSDPGALVDAALGLAEAIQLARYQHEGEAGGEAGADGGRDALLTRVQQAGRVVSLAATALTAASRRPRPDYAGAVAAVGELVTEFHHGKRVAAAAELTSKLDAWTKAITGKDEAATFAAAFALGQAISGLRGAIEEERAAARQAAADKLGPSEVPADDGGVLPPGPDGPGGEVGSPGARGDVDGPGHEEALAQHDLDVAALQHVVDDDAEEAPAVATAQAALRTGRASLFALTATHDAAARGAALGGGGRAYFGASVAVPASSGYNTHDLRDRDNVTTAAPSGGLGASGSRIEVVDARGKDTTEVRSYLAQHLGQAGAATGRGSTPGGNYTVIPGDTLGGISVRFRVPLQQLRTLNPQLGASARVFVGQRLQVPGADTALTPSVTTEESFGVDPDVAATATRAAGIEGARQIVATVRAQIVDWKKVGHLGWAFSIGLLGELGRDADEVERALAAPEIGATEAKALGRALHQHFLRVRTEFERLNGNKLSAVEAARMAASVVRDGASLILALGTVVPGGAGVSALYEAATKAIEARFVDGSSGTSAVLQGAAAGVLELVPGSTSVVRATLAAGFKAAAEAVVGYAAAVARDPAMSAQDKRRLMQQHAVRTSFVTMLGPLRALGEIAEADEALDRFEVVLINSVSEVAEKAFDAILGASAGAATR